MKKEANKVLIITGGHVKEEFLSKLLSEEHFALIIAADHGLMAVDKLGISPDYIVGDFDSVPDEILTKYRTSSTPTLTFPREKDKTDTQIALELAIEHNAANIMIVGATGSRLDHMIANIHLLLLPLQHKIEACIIDMNNKVYLKKDSFRIEKSRQHGDYLSLLPFSEEVCGLTLTGFKYPLNNITLTAGSSLGISNEILADIATVELNKGTLLVIESRD